LLCSRSGQSACSTMKEILYNMQPF
jgi:hypothetical protein